MQSLNLIAPIVLAFLGLAWAVPHHVRGHYEKDDSSEESRPVIDQRQNGTENYRIKVDGLALIVAPVDALLLAGAALENSTMGLLPNSSLPTLSVTAGDKPKPKFDIDSHKIEAKHSRKQPLRISNLLAPFLHRFNRQYLFTKVQ